jgi:hypothetical protein
MAYQSKKGIPLANGMRLSHGQIIGTPLPDATSFSQTFDSAATIANTSTKAKRRSPEAIHDGMRSRTSSTIATNGAPKCHDAAPSVVGHAVANADTGKPRG